MKACINTRYGPPEVVSVQDVERPVPLPDEMLIRIHATTVNRTDCGFRSAEYFISRFFSGLIRPNNKILGNEFAGVIEAIGEQVTTFSVGDKVFGYNDKTFGAHAEYMTLPESAPVVTMPEGLSFEEAAPITEGAHYALCDIRAAKVKPGDHVLVYGATGAIGSAAVQILKSMQVHVTAVCNTKNVSLIKSLGADVVTDYMTEDFTRTHQKYSFIFDAVGKSSFGVCKPLLTPDGIYISTELGKNWENIFLAITTRWFGKKKLLFPIPSISKDDVLYLKSLVEHKQLKPLIDRKYPLDKIVEAYTFVESGQKTGNVVITVNS